MAPSRIPQLAPTMFIGALLSASATAQPADDTTPQSQRTVELQVQALRVAQGDNQ